MRSRPPPHRESDLTGGKLGLFVVRARATAVLLNANQSRRARSHPLSWHQNGLVAVDGSTG